jgi:bifunctional DNA-binding transcriptional regulator/antitoxin component of YhaV-PrlF toxin-antitoxin module
MRVKMDQKRRLSVPVELAANIKPGDTFEAIFDTDEGEIIFRRINPQSNWVELFEQCPVPMDDLPPRSREYPKKLNL